jgi:hypothetical protein
MYVVDQDTNLELKFDNNIHFHAPLLIYGYEKNEFWTQNLDEPNTINRYIFINPISAYGLADPVYEESNRYTSIEKNYFELLLTYEKCHRIAKIWFSDTGPNVRIERMKKSIKFGSLPNSTIQSFFIASIAGSEL